MKLESVGVLISMRALNERDMLACIFSRDYGVMRGVLRGAVVARKNKPLIGQVGVAAWVARLDSQLGTFHWDADVNMAAPLMANHSLLLFMNAAFDLIVALVPEREKYASLYDATMQLLSKLAELQARAYLDWEICLLRELGYALDLCACSGCGARENLNWLSPRTGRAVCDSCAAPYIDKLFPLPLSMNITKKFLDFVCAGQGADLPLARKMLGA